MKKIWALDWSRSARKNIKRLDRPMQIRILKFFHERIIPHDNPRRLGKPLTGDLTGYWSFRIGKYRAICDIQDTTLVILLVDIDHRREVYDG